MLLGLPLVLLVGLLIAVLAGRSEPDPRRERPEAIYLSVVTFLGVGLLLAATWLTASGLMALTDTRGEAAGWFGGSGTSIEIAPVPRGRIAPRPLNPFEASKISYGDRNHDNDVSQVIGGLIAGALALGLLRFFSPKLQDLGDNSEGPGARIYARLLYLLCGTTLIVALGAAATAVYSVFGMIAPDTAGVGGVTDAVRSLLSAAALAVVAGYLFRRCWTRSEDLAAVGRPAPEPEPAP
jgi:hypothetical protein